MAEQGTTRAIFSLPEVIASTEPSNGHQAPSAFSRAPINGLMSMPLKEMLFGALPTTLLHSAMQYPPPHTNTLSFRVCLPSSFMDTVPGPSYVGKTTASEQTSANPLTSLLHTHRAGYTTALPQINSGFGYENETNKPLSTPESGYRSNTTSPTFPPVDTNSTNATNVEADNDENRQTVNATGDSYMGDNRFSIGQSSENLENNYYVGTEITQQSYETPSLSPRERGMSASSEPYMTSETMTSYSPTSGEANMPTNRMTGSRKQAQTGQKRKGTPYIPSYMDLTNGPEPCVVCGDAATGYHYRCMTCEGCKGFFRRTIQKGLTYHCKWSGTCQVDKTTRNQCQHCRYTKCLRVGMATDLVLNDKQRIAKRNLIEENRNKRRQEHTRFNYGSSPPPPSSGAASGSSETTGAPVAPSGHAHCGPDALTEADRALIAQVVEAYEQTATHAEKMQQYPSQEKNEATSNVNSPAETTSDHGPLPRSQKSLPGSQGSLPGSQGSLPGSQRSLPGSQGSQPGSQGSLHETQSALNPVSENPGAQVWQQLAEVLTPSILKVVDFAKRVPGFLQLCMEDQILLLKACCMEVMCLRAACRYSARDESLVLPGGVRLTRSQLSSHSGLCVLVEPIFELGVGLARLELDNTELALLAAVLLMQSDRSGLREPEKVEWLQDAILGAYKRYIAEQRPAQPVHWAKILMKVTDLRSISTRHAERVLCVQLDSPSRLPPLFLQIFNENPSNAITGLPETQSTSEGAPSSKSARLADNQSHGCQRHSQSHTSGLCSSTSGSSESVAYEFASTAENSSTYIDISASCSCASISGDFSHSYGSPERPRTPNVEVWSNKHINSNTNGFKFDSGTFSSIQHAAITPGSSQFYDPRAADVAQFINGTIPFSTISLAISVTGGDEAGS